MNYCSLLSAWVVCLCLATSAAHAVTCQSNLQPNNPDAAYTDHGDGTVTHTPTGLMWKRCAEGQTWSGSTCTGSATSSHTWAQALTLGSTASFAGHADWRLPSLKELRSLVEECRSNPSINDAIFPATPSSYFWSGSPHASYSDYAWDVYFNNGYSGYYSRSYNDYSVRLVRGGQSFDNLGLAGSPSAVKFTGENLPDGSYQVGAASKSWTFSNGATAITGLKAVPVTAEGAQLPEYWANYAKQRQLLGITTSEIIIGDVAANASFTVTLPIAPVRTGAALKSSTWKLVDGSGADVKISNSKSGQFWLRLRTNRAPGFSPLQLDSASAKVNQTASLPVLASDADGDALSFTASSGSVTSGVWSGSFANAGVQPVTLTVSDGTESAQTTIYVVVRDANGAAFSFSDVAPDSSATSCTIPPLLASGMVDVAKPGSTGLAKDYADLQYLYQRGVVMGTADGAQRKFEPCRYATQAEALKMLMEAARIAPAAGAWVFNEPPRPLNNLQVDNPAEGVFINATWAMPYVLKAEALGMITSANTFNPQLPATRTWVARVVKQLQALVVPVDAFASSQTSYQFPDEASFASPSDYNDALAAAFFGYMGTLGSNFNPADAMVRADVGRVASRILRAPRADDVLLDGTTATTVAGRSLPGVILGGTLQVKGLVNLTSDRIMRIGDTIKEEWQDTPASHVKASVIKVGQGIVANGTNILVSDLAASPVAVSTATPPATSTEVRNLLVLLQDTESGVRTVLRKDYAVLYPDRDGDGVRDDLDLWPDHVLFSIDANGNGIPDNVDAAFNTASRKGADKVSINGVQMSIVDALLAGKLQELSAALGGTGGAGGVSVGGVVYQPGGAVNLDFAQGWNLSGNGSDAPMNVPAAFNDSAKATTVWKWLPASSQWAFHAPSLSGQALTDYLASKGYAALATVNAGEGFWVNAKAPFSVSVSPGYAVTAAQFASKLTKGWNLVSVGEAPQTPATFNSLLGYDITTLWAWDNPLAQWYFYAPSLDKNGTLQSYISSKSYLDFTQKGKTLGWGTGVWVNKP